MQFQKNVIPSFRSYPVEPDKKTNLELELNTCRVTATNTKPIRSNHDRKPWKIPNGFFSPSSHQEDFQGSTYLVAKLIGTLNTMVNTKAVNSEPADAQRNICVVSLTLIMLMA